MENIVTFLAAHNWLAILIRIGLTILVTHLVISANRTLWERDTKNHQQLFRKFIYNIVRAIIYLLGIVVAVGQIPQLSQVVQTILAGSGIAALALSLSAQESLENIISGLFITLFKPFEVGNRVTLVGSSITGTIEDITLRHTIIKSFTNTRIVIPNSTMNKEIIENSQLIDPRVSNFVDVSVSYESDIDLAMEIMADVIGSHPYFLDLRTGEQMETVPKVRVYARALGSSGVELRASMWTRTVDENFDACSDVRLQIKKSFEAAGIEIPYTKYTILHQDQKDHRFGSPIQTE